jgi:hypothetical protein
MAAGGLVMLARGRQAADVVAALAARLDELARVIIAEAEAAAGEQWGEAGVVGFALTPPTPGPPGWSGSPCSSARRMP